MFDEDVIKAAYIDAANIMETDMDRNYLNDTHINENMASSAMETDIFTNTLQSNIPLSENHDASDTLSNSSSVAQIQMSDLINHNSNLSQHLALHNGINQPLPYSGRSKCSYCPIIDYHVIDTLSDQQERQNIKASFKIRKNEFNLNLTSKSDTDHKTCHHKILTESNLCDDGYMADSEIDSPSVKKKLMSYSIHKIESVADVSDDELSGKITRELKLPDNKGHIGLHRIRRGRIIKRALHISYVSILCGFIYCIVQLYDMLGVYGVLSNEQYADPWSWLYFVSFQR